MQNGRKLLVKEIEKLTDKCEKSQLADYYTMLTKKYCIKWLDAQICKILLIKKSLTKRTVKFCLFIRKNSIRNSRRNLSNKVTHVNPLLHFFNPLKGPKIFHFQGVYIWNIELKWVNVHFICNNCHMQYLESTWKNVKLFWNFPVSKLRGVSWTLSNI